MAQLEEPLLESAPLALRLAPRLCRKDPATGEDCSWLHGFWQCLRIMGLAAAPDRHADFYQGALAGVAGENGPPRLLVSGAADYSMLAHALAAFRLRGTEPAVTVIDLCDTPLYLNRWYADRVACRIETARCSVLDYTAAAPFDAICTHSFFGQFSSERRRGVVAAWREMLRPGGVVITAHPLRPWGPDEPNRFTPEQAEVLRATVRSRAEELQSSLGVNPEEIVRRAELYLGARYGFPVRSGEEFRALFEGAGFRVDHLACGPVAAGEQSGAGGPGLRHAKVNYASIVARRP